MGTLRREPGFASYGLEVRVHVESQAPLLIAKDHRSSGRPAPESPPSHRLGNLGRPCPTGEMQSSPVSSFQADVGGSVKLREGLGALLEWSRRASPNEVGSRRAILFLLSSST